MENSTNHDNKVKSANLVPFPETQSTSVAFDRRELSIILSLYGRKVAEGEWRDYAMDFGRDAASFAVFRRSSEQPLYRVTKNPALARRHALYAVVAQGGLIMKRGNDLAIVIKILEKN